MQPRRLYKFIERKYFDTFFRAGTLRLGTIHSFKDTIEYGESRGDKSEGEHSIIRSVAEPLTLTADKQEPIVSTFFNVKGNGSVQLSNMSFVVNHRCPDAFIFCTTYLFTDELFAAWHKREKLDACYEITDVKGFASAISKRIASSAWYAGNTNIIYRDEHIDYRSPVAAVSPAITKLRKSYEWQKENRMVWNPLLPSPPLKPWIIDVPEATRFCRPFALIDDGEVRSIPPNTREVEVVF